MTTWIATRNLTDRNGAPVSFSLSAPEQTPAGAWECEVLIKTAEGEVTGRGGGSDGFEALQTAELFLWHHAKEAGYTQVGQPTGFNGLYRPVFVHPLLHDADKTNAAIDASLEPLMNDPARRAEIRKHGNYAPDTE